MRCVPRLLILCLVPISVGCSSDAPLPSYDSHEAQATLVMALDAWKQGQVNTLAQRNPPVRLEDEDQRSGFELADYRLSERSEPLRPFDDVEVVLVLRDRRGNPVEKRVVYQVSLGAHPAVLRTD